MNNNLYILIMAGGEGVRFFPVSTPEKPKQFLSFWGDRTFLQQTYDRFTDMVPSANVYVATNSKYIDLVKEQLPDIPIENIIGEPEKRNTAPCIAYATKIISEKNKHAVVAVLPSDHVITKLEDFKNAIKRAVYVATEREVLVTLGIKPTWPADCYGYIKSDKMIEDDPDGQWHAFIVDSFIEKPSVAKAQYYMEDQRYHWNSGMFVWQAELILKEIKRYLPKMYTHLEEFAPERDICGFFSAVESISIDYGVMERSERVVTIPCDIGWSDIGTWQSLYNLTKETDIKLDSRIEHIMLEKVGK